MSIRIMSAVWEQSRARGGDLLVLLAIADFADDEGRAYPSVERLARKARLSERQVQRALRRLVRLGELAVDLGRGRRHVSLYTVLLGREPASGNGDNISVTNCRPSAGKGDIRDTEKVTSAPKKGDVDVTQNRHINRHLEPSVNTPSSALDAPTAGQARAQREPYPVDHPYYALAQRLDELIHANNPRARPVTEAQRQRWADEVRLMVERDGRDVAEIGPVLEWSQADPFWRSNILSMQSLRRQFDRLVLRMEDSHDARGARAAAGHLRAAAGRDPAGRARPRDDYDAALGLRAG